MIASTVGIAVTLFSDVAAAAYAVAGFFILWMVQIKLNHRQKFRWWLVGGSPFGKLDVTESRLAKIALSILGSVLVTFLAKIIYVARGA